MKTLQTKQAMIKELASASNKLEKLHLRIRAKPPLCRERTVDEVLTKLTHTRANISLLISWLEA